MQLHVLLALYNVLRRSITDPELVAGLYTFVQLPDNVNNMFIGLIDLSQRSIVLALLAGIVQFAQARMLQTQQPPKELAKKDGARDENMAANMTKTMTYTMPLITVVFGFTLPAGVMLYWMVSGLISVIQQWIILRDTDEEKKEGDAVEVEVVEKDAS